MKRSRNHASDNKSVRFNIFLSSDFLKDDMVLKSMIETGSLFHTLVTLSVKNDNLILYEI